MSPAQRRYLLLEQGIGSIVINFALNALIAWVMFRSQDEVPLWGQQSIMGDTIATSLILPFLTTLIVTPMARGHVRGGRVAVLPWTRATHPPLGWLPRATFARAFVLGLVCMVVLSPITLVVLTTLHVSGFGLWPFVLFKAGFAAAEGAIVTPLVALWALAEEPDSLRRAAGSAAR